VSESAVIQDSASLDCWEYFQVAVDIPSLKELTDVLNELGAQGWEVVTTTTTVKTFANVSGNKILILAKRRLLRPPPPQAPDAGWHDDPTGRFDKRYWDGRFWSVWVGTIDPKSTDKDPPTMLPPPDLGNDT